MVFRELWWGRSEVTALWNLWWKGFPVDEKRLRFFLHGRIKRLSVLHSQLSVAGDRLPSEPTDIIDQLGSCARARLKSKALGRLRRALRSERFAFFLHLLISVGVGLFDGWVDLEEDPRVLVDAFKLEASPDSSHLEHLSELFKPDNLRYALESASTQELNEARSRLSHVAKSLWFWLTPERIWNVEQRIGKRSAELISLVVNDPDFRLQVLPYIFLVTLTVLRTGNDEASRHMLVGELPMGGWSLFIS